MEGSAGDKKTKSGIAAMCRRRNSYSYLLLVYRPSRVSGRILFALIKNVLPSYFEQKHCEQAVKLRFLHEYYTAE